MSHSLNIEWFFLLMTNAVIHMALADPRQHSGAMWPLVIYERAEELQVTRTKCHMQSQHHTSIILQGKGTTPVLLSVVYLVNCYEG